MSRNTSFVSCLAACSVAYCGSAQAQAAAPESTPTSDAAQAEETASTTTQAPAQEEAGVQDIVVTAQKRSSLLQKTPAAITAVTDEVLIERGIADLPAAQVLIPSARFQIEQSSVQVFIRGVGASLDFANIQPIVALNLNGVSTPREGASAGFLDVAQVEVLPGPQGTLYGATAMGGTVNIAFNRPSDRMETKLLAEGGNYEYLHLTAVQNIPVSEKVAIRGAADFARRDGYQTSGANSLKDFSGRLSLQARPSDDVTIYLWGSYATKNGHPINVVTLSFNPTTGTVDNGAFLHPGNPWNDTRTGTLAPLAPFGPITALDQSYDNYTIGAQIDAKIGEATLTSISSYQRINSLQNFWLTAIPASLSQEYDQLTQEIRLSGETGRIRYLVGLYGSQLKNNGYFSLFGGGFFISNVTDHKLENVSGFGEIVYSASDKLRLTGGGRLSYYKRVGAGFASSGAPYDSKEDYTHVDFKLGADYDITDHVLAYAGFQTGYSPGTFNEQPSTPAFDNQVKPSKLSAWSAGIKSRFLRNAVQLNVEGYYYDYKDLLVQSYDINAFFNPIFNSQKTKIYGLQADLVVKPTRNDNFNLSVGYLHGRYTEFVQPNGADFSGNSIAFAPDWTITAGYGHDFQLASGYIRARGDVRYESEYWGDFAHVPGDLLGDFWLVDASLTYYSEDDRWNVGIWGKNLTDEAVPSSSAIGGIPGPVATQLGPPLTFGARLGFTF
ncbi:TonB-dependent receptor [Sphingomonas daechungensis]|uniref:TonB-dependent receptor n=1 Tax=Sphingomonas daechungensis TaxID=1176646 RepID=UPI0037835A8C